MKYDEFKIKGKSLDQDYYIYRKSIKEFFELNISVMELQENDNKENLYKTYVKLQNFTSAEIIKLKGKQFNLLLKEIILINTVESHGKKSNEPVTIEEMEKIYLYFVIKAVKITKYTMGKVENELSFYQILKLIEADKIVRTENIRDINASYNGNQEYIEELLGKIEMSFAEYMKKVKY